MRPAWSSGRGVGGLVSIALLATVPDLPAAGPAPAASMDTTVTALELGRALYHGERPPARAPRIAGTPLPSSAGCAACHGADGRGNREGGVRVPALGGDRIDLPATATVEARAGASANAQQWLRAAIDGRTADGRELRAPMPRYQFTATEQAALAEYLAVLGTEREPVRGVEARTIRLGTLLPSAGPRRVVADAIFSGLTDRIDRLNRSGGLFGRRVELTRIDSASLDRLDDAGQAAAWLRETVAHTPVLALVGNFIADPALLSSSMLKALRLPVIGGLSATYREPARDPSAPGWSSQLMPGVQAQARAAKAALDAQCPAGSAPLEVRHASSPGLREALAGALDGPGVRWPQSGAITAGGEAAPRRMLVVDEPGAVQAVRASLHGRDCLSSLAMFSGARTGATSGSSPREVIVLPAPANLPVASAEPAALWESLARLSASLAIEVLARSGRLLQPESVAAAQDAMPAFEPITGIELELTRERRHALPVTTAWRHDGQSR